MGMHEEEISRSRDGFESALATVRAFDSARAAKMAEFAKQLRDRLNRAIGEYGLDGLVVPADFDEGEWGRLSNGYYAHYGLLGRTELDAWPELVYDLPKMKWGEYGFRLVFEFNEALLYGLSCHDGSGERVEGSVPTLPDMFENAAWRCEARKRIERGWLWRLRLPSSSDFIDFVSCSERYVDLFDATSCAELLDQMAHLFAMAVFSVYETGLPPYLGTR